MREETHEKFMRGALAMARRGLGQTSPNPSVGAVIVKKDQDGDQIIARAVTGIGGIPHAEPQAIAIAGEQAKGSTLYVTLEPCNHQGRTPPCTEAIIAAGIARVIIASTDNDIRVKGTGIKRLKSAGIEVLTGILKSDADYLNAGHFYRQEKKRPLIIVKTAVAKDGLILEGNQKTPNQGPTWVTSELARARGWLWRAEVDAILIGTKTAIIDNPSLTCRLKGLKERSPQPILLDKELKCPPDLQLFAKTNKKPTLVFHNETQSKDQKTVYKQQRNVELLPAPITGDGQLCLATICETLAEKGMCRVLVEGGPEVSSSFLTQNLADELIVFKGNSSTAGKGRLPFHNKPLTWAIKECGFKLYNTQTLGNNEMRHYVRPKWLR